MQLLSTNPGKYPDRATLEECHMVIQRVSPFDEEAIAAIGEFRLRVWQAEGQKINESLINDGKWNDRLDVEPTSQHWVVYIGGEIAASSRISFHRDFTTVPDHNVFEPYVDNTGTLYCSLNRMVVHPRYRGLGIAGLLDFIRIKSAFRAGADQLFAYAVGSPRAQSLMRRGFVEKEVNDSWSIYPDNDGPFHALVIDHFAMGRASQAKPESVEKLLSNGSSILTVRNTGHIEISGEL